MTAHSARTQSLCRVAGLFVYPVKSLRGTALSQASITSRGIAGDREWMIVRADGRFLTQRELPRLALLAPRYEPGALHIEAPGHAALRVPLDAEGRRFETKVWEDTCEVIDAGEVAARWLDAVLGAPWPCRLVRMQPGFRRQLARAPLLGEHTSTAFADAAPLLVANTASLAALNAALAARAEGSVTMERFRPNIVLEGLAPYAEHAIAELHTGAGALRLCYPCERCAVITVDPARGERDAAGIAAFRTLAGQNALPGTNKPLFGMNATWSGGVTSLAMGHEFVIHH